MLLSKIALGVYAVSIPELLRGRSGFESSLYFMMTIKYSIVSGTVITWLMWLDKFQIKGWVFLNVVFATTVIHGLIGFCTHLFRLKPTGDPNILVHGIELVQFERFHLLLNSRVHLSMYYIMKDAFILATIIGLVYMFLSYYRNRRIVLSGLVVED